MAQNDANVRQIEDDAEKTTMRYLEYRNERELLEEKRSGKLTKSNCGELAKLAERKGHLDRSLKQCLQSEDVIWYWKALMSVAVGGRFINTKHFASKWTEKMVH